MKELCDAVMEALMTLKLRLKNKANKIFRQAMRRFEPEFFYEKNLFSPESEEANRWRLFWVVEKVCLILVLLALYSKKWWILAILGFALLISRWKRNSLIATPINPEYTDYIDPNTVTGYSPGRAIVGWGCGLPFFGMICAAVFGFFYQFFRAFS